MNPVTYNFKDASSSSIGLIAQEVKDVLNNTSLPSLTYESSEGMLGMNYTGLIPLLIKQIQVLSKRIDEIEK